MMRMFYAALVGGALLASAGAAQAQTVFYDQAPGTYGYGYQNDYAATLDAINPGASYGLNSTESGVAGATVGGTTVNASSQADTMPRALETGRAATYGAPPMGHW